MGEVGWCAVVVFGAELGGCVEWVLLEVIEIGWFLDWILWRFEIRLDLVFSA